MKSALCFCFALTLIVNQMLSQGIYSDCISPLHICQKSPIAVEKLNGSGIDDKEIGSIPCFKTGYIEKNSIWIQWTIKDPGNLAFTILPVESSDDVDFILYSVQSTKSEENCTSKVPIRCMVAGANLGEDKLSASGCTGATGLSNTSTDEQESTGCNSTNDNFLRNIDCKSGETYLLVVNNFSSKKGFLLEFSGNCTFSEDDKCQILNTSNTVFQQENTTTGLQLVNIYPNPTSSVLNVAMTSLSSEIVDIQIISISGQIVLDKTLLLNSGENAIELKTDNLINGVWFLKIKGKSSCVISRFTKN